MTTPWPDEAALPPLRPVIDVPLPEETEMSDEPAECGDHCQTDMHPECLVCTLPSGHAGPHKEGFTTWTRDAPAQTPADAPTPPHPSTTHPSPSDSASGPVGSAVPEHLRGDGPCSDCGTVDNINWWVESVFWNQIVRQGDYLEPILCIPCFVARTDAAGFRPQGWSLVPNWHWETKAERAARMDAASVEGGGDV